MYTIVKGAIAAGGYKLADMQERIKSFYARGEISEKEKNELIVLAAGNASAEEERPAVLELVCLLAEKVAKLAEEVASLWNNQGAESPDVGTDNDSGEVTVTYPAWKAWDGISKDYAIGAIVSHNGKLWESVFAGQNVWEPGTVGTETLWVVYTPAEG